MLVAGLDMGHLTTKVVVLSDDGILASVILMAAEEGEIEARKALDNALEGTGLAIDDVEFVVATGAGRKSVPFAQKQRAPASCLAKGIHRLYPSVRTLIDVGAETCTVVKVNEKGTLDDSAGNERCASGTGVFLEAMATRLLHMPLDEFAQRSLQAQSVAEVSNMCAIFAEQEVISHVHRDPPTPVNDVIAGIHSSMATRVGGLAKRLGIKEDVAFTGGVAKNVGFMKTLGDNLGVKLVIPEEPQLVAALGAAVAAGEEAARRVQV